MKARSNTWPAGARAGHFDETHDAAMIVVERSTRGTTKPLPSKGCCTGGAGVGERDRRGGGVWNGSTERGEVRVEGRDERRDAGGRHGQHDGAGSDVGVAFGVNGVGSSPGKRRDAGVAVERVRGQRSHERSRELFEAAGEGPKDPVR